MNNTPYDRDVFHDLHHSLASSVAEYAIFVVSCDGVISGWNPGVLKNLGYSEQEFIGQPFSMLFTPEDRQKDAPKQEMKTAAKRGYSADRRYHLRRDGTRIFVDGVLTAIHDAGRVTGFAKILRDDSDRKRMEEERERLLAEVTDRAGELDAIFASISDGLYVGTAKGIKKTNEPGLRMLGFSSPEEMDVDIRRLSEHLDNRLYATGERLTEETEPFSRALRGERAVEDVETRNIKTGDRRIVRSAASPIWRDGQVVGAVAINTDITRQLELLKSEQDARRIAETNEKNYRFLAESIPEIVWVSNQRGVCEYYNPRWYEFTGIDGEALNVNPWYQVVDPSVRQQCIDKWNESLACGATFEMELPLLRYDNRSCWHLCRALPQRENGQVTRWTGICTNIDDRKRSEQTLIQAAKLEGIGVLAGGIAHDFNNLLTGMLGNTSLAIEMLPPAHQAGRFLSDVVRAVESAAHLTRQLLAYAGKGRFTMDQIQLAKAVPQTLDMIRTAIPHNVEIRLQLPQDLPLIEADLSQLQQIVINLVLNAAEAIPDGARGIVSIAASTRQVKENFLADNQRIFPAEPGLFVSLRVRDNGVGMSPETLSKIFDPFFTTKFTGRGLGLAAVSGIARGHKGAILTQSELGQGSMFELLLPACGIGEGRKPSSEAAAAHSRGTVLVVDDQEVVRRVAENALVSNSYKVLLAASGEEAVEIFLATHGNISVILLDLTMPGSSIAEVMRRLHDTDPEVPIVLSSGFDESEAQTLFEDFPIAGFLPKPYTARTLVSTMEEAIRRRPRK